MQKHHTIAMLTRCDLTLLFLNYGFFCQINYELKFSDDGEPSGTGGKPIYGVIESEDIDRVCVLVTRSNMIFYFTMLKCFRYFGGIKLGVGPLGRAYADAARLCLRAAETVTVRPTVTISHTNAAFTYKTV